MKIADLSPDAIRQSVLASAAGGNLDSRVHDDLGLRIADLATRGLAYPGTPRSNRPPVAAMALYAKLLRMRGAAIPTFGNGANDEWIPIGTIGSILVVGHFWPGYMDSLVLPPELVQPVIIPVETYVSFCTFLKAQEEFLSELHADEADCTSLKSFQEWLAHDGGSKRPSDARNALSWLLAHGLVGANEMGSAVTASTGEFRLEDMTADMQLTLARITTGCPIGRRDLFHFQATRTGSAAPALLERIQAYPFWQHGRTFGVLVADSKDRAVDDQLAGTGAGKIFKVTVAKQTLIALFQEPSEAKDTRADLAGTKVRHAAPAITIIAGTIERFNPRAVDDASAPQTLQWILNEAIRRRASDIHIEIKGDDMLVRISSDNTGRILLQLPSRRIKGIHQLLKTHSSLPTDGNNHGEGRFSFEVNQRIVDVRTSLIVVRNRDPKWTLRLQDKVMSVRTLSHLALGKAELESLRAAFARPYGMMLVSGPTGHGKSTTLYAGLTEINRPERFIYTLEDPIELEIDGIQQIAATSDHVRIAEGGLSFHGGIKRCLRAAPNVIMVGEIRDAATAAAGIEASNTGHLLISTVHANNCGTVLSRMAELGVDPRLFAESIAFVSSQRLIRKLCSCHGHVPLSDIDRDLFGSRGITPPKRLFVAGGCDTCDNTGYYGRAVVMEILPLPRSIRAAISMGRPSQEIIEAAEALGFQDLFHKGLIMAAQGVTSLEEVKKTCLSASD